MSFIVLAQNGDVVSEVEYIRTHDAGNAAWKPPVFWFTLKGVSVADSCPTWNNRALFVGNTDQMYSMLLASQRSGGSVQVGYNTAYLLNGFCKAQYVSIGDPPPSSM